MSPNPSTCSECGSTISPGSPAGLCPKCLLQQGLENQSAAVGTPQPTQSWQATPGKDFVPPSSEELARAFPQLEILELLGKGGMGAVYKARQRGLDRLVAVKILPSEIANDPSFTARFTREAKALACLNHPNIVAVHEFGQAGGLYYFVMEYVDGVNLRQAMRAGKLTSAEALKVVPQLCDALQYAHDEGMVHRDIKPENVLVDRRGRVKMVDFGLAKLLGRGSGHATLTGTQQVMGTLHYMAPEQLEGSRGVDHRADIFSLGVTFYEMLTGELPIGRFAPPSQKVQIDVRLDEVVLRTLEKEPEKRYQHASEVKTDVETIVCEPRTTVTPRPPVPTFAAADEHPLLKGLRFWMTPQSPSYVRWVSIPLLVLLGLYMLTEVVVMALVPQSQEAVHGGVLCGGTTALAVSCMILHLVWMAKGRR